MSQLPATLSPTCSAEEKNSQGIEPKVPWGILYPHKLGLKTVELYDEEFTFGRSFDCTVRAEERFITKGRIRYISILHFSISKKSNHSVVIRDLSRNGTWTNNIFIGKNKEAILEDGDVISVGMKNYTIYMFKHLNRRKDVPDEIQRKFVITETLGNGAFGKVNLAFLKRGYLPRAIKKLVKGTASSDKNNPTKIKNEIEILRSLSHPNIVSMIEFFENDEAFFIVLEYMKGGTLQDRIDKRNCMSEKEVKPIFYQIIRAVKYLHENGITHRDLKPANILLTSDDVQTIAKISDFGLSKIKENDSLLETPCGTPHFVAPEVWLYSKYTKKVDIWSTGVILYFMLSKKLPFAPESRLNNAYMVRKLVIHGKYSTSGRIWETVSSDAKAVLRLMLTTNPNDRADALQIERHSWLSDDEDMKLKVEALIADYDQALDDSIDERQIKRTRLIA